MRGSRHGFSLIEVIVAMAILAIAFTALMSGMSTALRTTADLEAHDRRMELARSKLAQIDLLPTPALDDMAFGRFEDGTAWRIQVLPFIEGRPDTGNRSVVRIALTLEWMGRSGTQGWTASTYRVLEPASRELPPLEEQLDAIR